MSLFGLPISEVLWFERKQNLCQMLRFERREGGVFSNQPIEIFIQQVPSKYSLGHFDLVEKAYFRKAS